MIQHVADLALSCGHSSTSSYPLGADGPSDMARRFVSFMKMLETLKGLIHGSE
jgi:hypothetical protein